MVMDNYMDQVSGGQKTKVEKDPGIELLQDLGEVTKTTLDQKKCKAAIRMLKTKLLKFTKDWNEDDSNRDKTVTVFNQLA
mmetsp:Transcript_35941/g.55222  ORF Transcript_35941/g.55222 Transcript_35941/m.55222 type:complete len:80 (+) Transcript_35941:327-566(+)|eukprot:CAMPEP_0170494692 /NCGR_PEP_ID=MMETSP0208-20121228/14785_1 /TAXON_ID=197538 /ORGANISM="Strombidium inclinatum, Strain S3" /LENGTH=79 /DNA_ID=CAMNT_0010770779 /DNA_START=326 /DNA_END=565 /DNA_ORIENTATION=-